ncbi:MAG: FAD:protein FMN transferase [Gammaproteobacteria bacterium]|nr:FAD:protein FMN transferase [Gammaproteobacteria bacterium]MDH5275393.1 FAD:protein FMN transferase [Gammaproteobacteria bacterium]
MQVSLSCALLLVLVMLPARAEWYTDTQQKMGTRIEIQIWADSEAEALPLIAAGMAEFDRIESWMSTFREDSEISRVNRLAAHEAVATSAELFGIVQRSLELSVLSGGAFDITFDSVGQLYDFRAGVRPDRAAIEEQLPSINYRHVILDPVKSTIRFSEEGTRINLGGIGKGYACDKVADLLRAAGVKSGRVNAGGDTRLIGDRQGRPWVMGIRDPDAGDRWVTRLALDDEAISTAGDYERFFEEDGVRYHHIINPKTGDSARGVRSVTVIGPDATMTDGLDNAVFILGPERGLALIDATPGYAAVVVDAAHNVRFSKALQAQ